MDIKNIETTLPYPHEKPLEPGDFYVAQGNGPAIIAICRKHDLEIGCVFPENFGLRPEGGGLDVIYSYNTKDCRRISKETYNKLAQQVNTEYKNWSLNFRIKS